MTEFCVPFPLREPLKPNFLLPKFFFKMNIPLQCYFSYLKHHSILCIRIFFKKLFFQSNNFLPDLQLFKNVTKSCIAPLSQSNFFLFLLLLQIIKISSYLIELQLSRTICKKYPFSLKIKEPERFSKIIRKISQDNKSGA